VEARVRESDDMTRWTGDHTARLTRFRGTQIKRRYLTIVYGGITEDVLYLNEKNKLGVPCKNRKWFRERWQWRMMVDGSEQPQNMQSGIDPL